MVFKPGVGRQLRRRQDLRRLAKRPAPTTKALSLYAPQLLRPFPHPVGQIPVRPGRPWYRRRNATPAVPSAAESFAFKFSTSGKVQSYLGRYFSFSFFFFLFLQRNSSNGPAEGMRTRTEAPPLRFLLNLEHGSRGGVIALGSDQSGERVGEARARVSSGPKG